ncbi:hypothetical protein ACFL5V_12025, partial [Fibrobacterota bacterium]
MMFKACFIILSLTISTFAVSETFFETGIDKLHAAGLTGKNVLVAIIDPDFPDITSYNFRNADGTTRFVALALSRD